MSVAHGAAKLLRVTQRNRPSCHRWPTEQPNCSVGHREPSLLSQVAHRAVKLHRVTQRTVPLVTCGPQSSQTTPCDTKNRPSWRECAPMARKHKGRQRTIPVSHLLPLTSNLLPHKSHIRYRKRRERQRQQPDQMRPDQQHALPQR